ncbi:MAG TPA: S53 family peptidase [Thermoanaerobaculia bacterium]|jgi:kumamolisin
MAKATTEKRLRVEHGEPRTLPPHVARSNAAVDLSEQATVTLVVRSRGSDEEWRALVAQLTHGLPHERRYLSRAQFARKWSASRADLEAVRAFAKQHKLDVVSSDAFRRCVVVRGTLRNLGRAFGVEFHHVDHPLGRFRSHAGAPHLPASIHPLIECILGLDTVPVTRTHATAKPSGKGSMDRRALLTAYSVPPRLRGKGECIAIIELGGGYHRSDLAAYFKQLRLEPPRMRVRGIDGVKNDPASAETIEKFQDELAHFDPSNPYASPLDPKVVHAATWTIETTVDICLAATIAPDASILLVQSTNDDQGQYHAVTTVFADTKSAPSVLSCSWGATEAHNTPALMHALDRWFQAAAILGITVCFSSGDHGDGTLNAPTDKTMTVDFPGSSPHVLCCGGTTLHSKAGTESAWRQKQGALEMASGGGFSSVFPIPHWQSAAAIDPKAWIPSGMQSGNGRALPDVAAKADLSDAYSVIVAGLETPAGGTSAAAPLWAALAAIFNQGLKTRTGALHTLLYDGTLQPALRDITTGNTGHFHATKGWDPCTGWGSPHGEALLRTLRGKAR